MIMRVHEKFIPVTGIQTHKFEAIPSVFIPVWGAESFGIIIGFRCSCICVSLDGTLADETTIEQKQTQTSQLHAWLQTQELVIVTNCKIRDQIYFIFPKLLLFANNSTLTAVKKSTKVYNMKQSF